MNLHAGITAHRLRRLWELAEAVYARPGQTRAELARAFVLQERHTNNDLLLLRDAWDLPLVRNRGYRFEGPVGSPLDLGDALTLARLPQTDATRRLAAHASALFRPHLRPLADALLVHERSATVFQPIVAALLAESWVRLHRDNGVLLEPAETVLPQVVVRHNGAWVLVCLEHQPYSRRVRERALSLESVRSVTAAVVGRSQKARVS